MATLLLLSAIPLTLALCSLIIPDIKVTRRLVALLHWAQLALVIWIVMPVLQTHEKMQLTPDMAIDHLGALFLMLTTLVTASSLTHAQYFFTHDEEHAEQVERLHPKLFYACINLFLLAMSSVFICDNLGYLWISIEATTLSSAPLVYFDRTKHALEATWKYLIICSVGIAFALLGTVLIFASSQHGAFANGSLNISELMSKAKDLQYSLLRVGFIFCLLGYGTKSGMFPLHSWLPDAHSEAPAPASAMLSGSLLNCALFGIWRVSQIVAASQHQSLTFILAGGLGTITVVAASLFLIRQHNFKRLWAYSSMENVGIMLVAIGLGSGPLFFLQALNHSAAKVALFLLAGNVTQAAGTKNLHDLKGVVKAAPIWAGLLAMATFAVTGAPPFGAFISEVSILAASADAQHWLVALFLVIAISLSFVAVCTHVGKVLYGTPSSRFKLFHPVATSVVPAILVLGTLVLGIMLSPQFWMAIQ